MEWDAIQKGDGRLVVQVNRPVYSMYLNHNSQYLYCGTAGGNLHVIDLASQKEVRNIEAHQHGLFDIKAINGYLITAGGDGLVRIWKEEGMELIHTIEASSKSARVIAYHPLVNVFAVGFSDHMIRLYDAATFQLQLELKGHVNSVFALSYSPDGQSLYSGGRDVYLKQWYPLASGIPSWDVPAHTLHINAIAFAPNGRFFITVSMDKTIKIWDALNNTLLKVVDKQRHEGHITSVNKVLWLNNEEWITCSDDRTIMMWRLDLL